MKTLRFVTLLLALCAFLVLPSCTKKKPPTTLSGQIEIAPLLARVPIRKTAALYLIARVAGAGDAPPIAVKRFVPPFHFPIAFTVSSQDEMIPGVPFRGPFDITARLSQSGSATPPSKGDFEGTAEPVNVQLGATDVVIRLNQVRQTTLKTAAGPFHSEFGHLKHRG